MTLDDLNQYKYLSKLIRLEQDRIQELRDSLGPRTSQLSGMPRASGAQDRIGHTMPTIVDKEAELAEKIQMLQEKKLEIEDWIEAQPVKIQIICQLRFLQNLSWNKVADRMDTGEGRILTADSVRASLKNHLARQSTGGQEHEHTLKE